MKLNYISIPYGIIALCATLIITSCATQEPDESSASETEKRTAGPVTLTDWLPGDWLLFAKSDEARRVIESWELVNDSSMSGNSYFLLLKPAEEGGADTFSMEELWMEKRRGFWAYTAKPEGQSTTVFTEAVVSDSMFRVENPAHDFPTFIEYRLWPGDTLTASIGDSSRSRLFRMVRLP